VPTLNKVKRKKRISGFAGAPPKDFRRLKKMYDRPTLIKLSVAEPTWPLIFSYVTYDTLLYTISYGVKLA
jgi:hypothetical protein